MTHDSDEHRNPGHPARQEPEQKRFGWHPDVPEPSAIERQRADLFRDAEQAPFTGPSLLGETPRHEPAYWTPGRPGELPPTIIQRKQPPTTQELLARYSKPAMMALTVAAVSSAGLVQNTQSTAAQSVGQDDSDDSRTIRTAATAHQPQLFELMDETTTEAGSPATGNSADRTEPFVYTVENGDWVRHIAQDFGLQTMTVVWNNDLPDPDYILPGQELLILPVDGLMVEVQPGDTLNSLATRYGVSTTAIINYEPNGITDPDLIQPGDVLIVPGGVPPQQEATSEPTSDDSGEQTTTQSAETSEPDPEPDGSDGDTSNDVTETGDIVTIQPGDTLATLAERHGISTDALVDINEITDADSLYPGDEIMLPLGVEPQPEPEPEPEPEPDPEPVEDTTTDQDSDPPATEEPDPTPTEEPDPTPTPEPEPDPTPTPTPEPEPTETEEPDAASDPDQSSSGVPTTIEGQLDYYANQYGLDPNLIKAVAWLESTWDHDVRSSAGAIGVMQIMPGTADFINNNLVSRDLDVRGSAADNIEAGTAYLAHRIDQFGDVEHGLAAYYMGPATVQNQGITSTGRNYVDRVLTIRDRIASTGSP